MQQALSRGILTACLALTAFLAQAQVEHLSSWQQEHYLSLLPDVTAKTKDGVLQSHLQRIAKNTSPTAKQAVINAIRVAHDVAEIDLRGPFVHYSIPAMSDNQRLADMYPSDGQANAAVNILAARGEFEPGAFVVYPLSDLGKVAFSLTKFVATNGVIFPTEQLDLKLVKIWYQNKNAWYSYFGDTGFKLVAELLLNDEDLIQVDEEKEANYARLKAADATISLQWINPPRQMDKRRPWPGGGSPGVFAPMKPDFCDADTLQPVALSEGRFTTFFLTAHVASNTPAGRYTGAVQLSRQGKNIGEIPVLIKVLPFELPAPKCYFDTTKDYLTTSYSYISLDLIMQENGGDRALAIKQLREVLRNQVAHNQLIHRPRTDRDTEVRITHQIMREVGMLMNPLISGINPRAQYYPGNRERNAFAQRAAQWFDKYNGHHNVYISYGDEPGARWLMEARPVYEAYQRAGFKFFIAGGNSVFYKTGYLYDWHNVAKWPEDDSSTRLWNQVGNAHVAWYASMHVGPENPAFNRRQYGMAPYLANYSATANYAHHFGAYNDDRLTYRPMVFAYGVYGGVIDTIQWEGYREGIDDIRYATLLKTLAQQAAKSPSLEARYAGNKALQFMALLDPASGDLNTLRYEMITRILALREIL